MNSLVLEMALILSLSTTSLTSNTARQSLNSCEEEEDMPHDNGQRFGRERGGGKVEGGSRTVR